jgi:cytochrome b pre-mRNA-processing protein 3
MLNFLFRGLTAQPAIGAALFDAVTREARARHWYVEGAVSDTLDGRFAVLASLTALVMLRLEAFGESGNRLSVALTERFVQVMESEHRELGIGDPTLGKTVRKLVALLARRVDAFRSDDGWSVAAEANVPGAPEGAEHRAAALEAFAARLGASGLEALAKGEIA